MCKGQGGIRVSGAGEECCVLWLSSRATLLRVLDRPDIVTLGRVTSDDVSGYLNPRDVNWRAADVGCLFIWPVPHFRRQRRGEPLEVSA